MAALTAALIATTVASAGLSAAGSVKAGRAARKQGNYEGDIFDFNADVADLQAKDALARGTEAERRLRQDVKRTVGSQRAGLAASGVDIGSGSAVDVQAETVALGELDALTIRNNARREAWGFSVDAKNARMQGNLVRKGGRASARQGAFNAGVSLLSGGVQAASIYREHK